MTWLLVIALFFMGVPIAEAVAARIKKGGDPADPEVKKALQNAEQRLAASETRLATLEERVDFYEKLLEKPKESGETVKRGSGE
ncbi:MAG TPA: hypothetical protein VGC44_08100 [Longimicrobiales bacterium]